MKWITVNEFISIDGIAAEFANRMSEMKRHQETNQLIGKLVRLRDYWNEDFQAIMKLFRQK